MRVRLLHAARAVAHILFPVLLVLLPWWRHRVLVHRPPFEVHFVLHDLIAYTSDYVLLAVLVVGWLTVTASRRGFRSGPRFVTVPLIAAVILICVSALWAVDPLYAGYQGVRHLLLLALYLLLLNLPMPRTLVVGGVATSVALQSVVGLLQVRLGHSLGLQWLGELSLDPDWAGVSVVMAGSERWLRAYGLTQHPNLLGGLLVALLLILVGGYLDLDISRRRQTALLLAIYGLGLGALLMTFSRGAWLAAGVGGLTVLGLIIRSGQLVWRKLLPLVTVTLSIGALFVTTQWALLRPRLGISYQGVEVRSVDERATLINGAHTLRRMRPVLGVGAGGFSTALHDLAPESISDYPIFQPVHNVLLLLATELGPLGPALWGVLTLAPPIAFWVGRPRSEVGWMAGMAGVLMAFFAAGWIEAYPWSSHQGTLMLWLVLGLWARAWSTKSEE